MSQHETDDMPAASIRQYLEEQGGEAEVPFHNLLTSWQVSEPTAPRRAAIAQALHTEGIFTEPPLTDLELDDPVRLTLTYDVTEDAEQGLPARSAPPWTNQPASAAATPEPTERSRGNRGRVAAAAAVFVLLAAGAAGGGYALGKSGGEDLDAARAKGAAQGQHEGAARGAESGYDAGLKQGEKAGYKQTYKKSYDRAYKRELKKAGLTPEQVSSE